MLLELHLPHKLCADKLEKAEHFESRTIEVDEVVSFRYARNLTEEKVGFNIVLKMIGAQNSADWLMCGVNEATQKRYEQISEKTGWKISRDWDSQVCLFAEGGMVDNEFGIHAAGEFWASYDLVDFEVERRPF
jgi:hypothetical protein